MTNPRYSTVLSLDQHDHERTEKLRTGKDKWKIVDIYRAGLLAIENRLIGKPEGK